MKEGTLYFFLKLNTEGKTKWQYEDAERLNETYDAFLDGVKYDLCNEDGYFHLICSNFELKCNRIAVDFSYLVYDGFTEEFVKMFDSFAEAVTERIRNVLTEKQIKMRNTDVFWYNADTIIFDDEPLSDEFYILKIEEVDKVEATFRLNRLSQNKGGEKNDDHS